MNLIIPFVRNVKSTNRLWVTNILCLITSAITLYFGWTHFPTVFTCESGKRKKGKT